MKRYFLSLFIVHMGLSLLILSGCGGASPTATPTPTTPPPTDTPTPTPIPRSALIKSVAGTVEIRNLPDGAFAPVKAGQTLAVGQELRTGKDGRAIIALDDGTALAVAPNTSLSLQALEGTHETPITKLLLNIGQLFTVGHGDLATGAAYEVTTPVGVATIRGSMMGVSYSKAKGSQVTCLVGHCTASSKGKEVALTAGKAAAITAAGVGAVKDMSKQEITSWSVTLNQVEAAGVDIKDSAGKDCSCSGADLKCTDGTTLPAYPSCTAGAKCSCQGSDLVCGDKTYANDPVCKLSAQNCTCQGPNLFCADGSAFYNNLACTSGQACTCSGPDLTCPDGTVYANNLACTTSSVGCTCTEGFQVCADGSFRYDPSACASNIPCVCQGTTFVCTQGGQSVSIPDYLGCGGSGGGVPQVPGVPDVPLPPS